MNNNTCPYCSHLLLREFRRGTLQWYCGHCHQSVPNLSEVFQLHQSRSLCAAVTQTAAKSLGISDEIARCTSTEMDYCLAC